MAEKSRGVLWEFRREGDKAVCALSPCTAGTLHVDTEVTS